MVKKTNYTAPETTLISVRLEAAICNGSVDIKNPDDKETGQIQDQKINDLFDGDFTGTEWTAPSTSTTN